MVAFELWCWRRLLRVPWTEGDPIRPSQRKLVLSVHWKDWFWSWDSNTSATWYQELTHLKRPWGWERLKEGGKGDDKEWDGWMASLTWWTWVCVNSMSWWWTGKPGVLQSMGSQRVRHDWVTELNSTDFKIWLKNWLLFSKSLFVLNQHPHRMGQALHIVSYSLFLALPFTSLFSLSMKTDKGRVSQIVIQVSNSPEALV